MKRILLTLVALLLASFAALHAADNQMAEKQWSVDGVTRTALLYAPSNATATATPVVFAFHGHGGSIQKAAAHFGYQRVWPEASVVYMQGLPTPSRAVDPEGKMSGWQKTAGDQQDRDLKFFDQVLSSLKKNYKIDEKRIYATGHSNGGGFTYLLWAERGDILAAIAPVAGGARPSKNRQPLPVMQISGKNDEIVPFAGQQRIMEVIRTLNHCEPDGKPWATAGTLVGTLYPSKIGAPFVFVVHPGTHKFPAEAPELIVKFFKENVRK